MYVPKQTPTLKDNNTVLAADYDGETLYIYFRYFSNNAKVKEWWNTRKNSYSIYTSRKKGGEGDYYVTPISKTEVYASGPSAFEIYKMQMLEALENLPKNLSKVMVLLT